MKRKKLSKSTRIFIRREKARIRYEVKNPEDQKKMISQLYAVYKK